MSQIYGYLFYSWWRTPSITVCSDCNTRAYTEEREYLTFKLSEDESQIPNEEQKAGWTHEAFMSFLNNKIITIGEKITQVVPIAACQASGILALETSKTFPKNP